MLDGQQAHGLQEAVGGDILVGEGADHLGLGLEPLLVGVEDVEVSAQTGKLVVSGSGEIDDAKVLAAVEEAGYTAVRA